jgi:hypothetical protein
MASTFRTLLISTNGRSLWETQAMKTNIQLFYMVLTFLFAAASPTARAVCQHGCDPSNANTFLGDDALVNNTTGNNNTATGVDALGENTTGSNNTATGLQALLNNTTGEFNTATGQQALFSSVNNGNFNTATGANALFNNASSNNTATGFAALLLNTTGSSNTATGVSALDENTTGSNNTATGLKALLNNTTGGNNIAVGANAGINLSTGDNNIDIGNQGVGGESNTIRIGTSETQTATFVAGIRGVPITGGTAIGVNASGQLGVKPSSVRYKEAIQPMDKASEAILALKPVTFRYKKEFDPKAAAQFGLVAEEVAKVDPDLVVVDDQGKPFTVRYEEVNAMLLNEFLKEHREVAELKSTVAEQRKGMEAMATQLKEQAAQIQKVSAQREMNQSLPQIIVSNH